MSTLLIQSSARREASVTRALAADLAAGLGAPVVERDVADGVAFVDEGWIGASFTPEAERSAAQKARLAGSDALVAEVMAADTLVIGVPIYNFGVPASLKAWIDQIARAKVTFEYTPDGPRGLLRGKRAFIVVASGGTEAESAVDFATPYLRHVLGFIGISDVTVIRADRAMVRGEAAQIEAAAEIAALTGRAAAA
ncbi:MAG: NAD(P)H-dependent oxidoreductase [Pseudomonadota bacterium]